MSDKFIVFGQPKIEQDEIDEVVDSLKKNWLGMGPKVERFEKIFKKFKGCAHAIALNSCTAGLHICCKALNLKEGDEVITTAMTFCATVNAIIHGGGIPVLADIDPHTLNIAPEEIEKKITSRTRAIIPVHFAGRICDMASILEIAKKYGLTIIEDCAHAVEAEYKGKKAGTFGDFGVFSFYSTKNVTTGEGGMIISQNEIIIRWLKMLTQNGLSSNAWRRFSDEGYKHYFVEEAGFKYNMMDIQASLGIHQLSRVEANWLKRKKIWESYSQQLRGLPITLPFPNEEDMKHSYHLFTLQIDEKTSGLTRDNFLVEMKNRNIGMGVHYLAIPEHPFYQNQFQWKIDDYPNAVRYGRQTVSLPLSTGMSEEDVFRVINAVKKILGGAS